MKTTIAKVTLIIGLINLLLIGWESVCTIQGLVSHSFFSLDMPLRVYVKLIVIPLLWIALYVVLYTLFLHNRYDSKFLVGAVFCVNLVDMAYIVIFAPDYLRRSTLFLAFRVLFLVAIGLWCMNRESRKVAICFLTVSYLVKGIGVLRGSVGVLRILDGPENDFWVYFLGGLLQPVFRFAAMLLFTGWILFPDKYYRNECEPGGGTDDNG